MKSNSSHRSLSRKGLFLTLAILSVFVITFVANKSLSTKTSAPAAALGKIKKTEKVDPQRIIALAPSIVEVVYQLGLEDKLVGVSRFCKYPEAAKKKPVVGGYIDLDFEAVIRLKPDCVILLKEQQPVVEKLQNLSINTVVVDHASVRGIKESIRQIAQPFEKEAQAEYQISEIHARVSNVKKGQPEKVPSVLLIIGRDRNSSSTSAPSGITAAGNKGVHQEYITIAGGVNAYQGAVAYPMLSREKLIHADPDIIVELVLEDSWNSIGRESLLKQWQQFSELRAVQNQQIIFLHEDKHMIPGPRFVDTLEEISKAIQDYGKSQ